MLLSSMLHVACQLTFRRTRECYRSAMRTGFVFENDQHQPPRIEAYYAHAQSTRALNTPGPGDQSFLFKLADELKEE